MLDDLQIPLPDPSLAEKVQAAIDIKTKPPGSLGRIEELALRMALAQGTEAPAADPAHLLIFAGDHGMVAEGVSAWPSEVTAQMVLNFLSGGAAANVFARTSGCAITVADAGVAASLPHHPDLRRAGISRGTRNAVVEDAMTEEEVVGALGFGADLAIEAVRGGARVIALGEMGIGNTSAGALLGHAVAGLNLAGLTGPGAGLDQAGVGRKLAILERAAGRRPGPLSPAVALEAFGGLEIAAMVGAMIGAASQRAVVLVDGYIATAAALVAVRGRPGIEPYLVYSHRSLEPGHRLLLDELGAAPLLDLGMRLGEGTGALLAVPLLRASCAMLAQMATFESAGISDRH